MHHISELSAAADGAKKRRGKRKKIYAIIYLFFQFQYKKIQTFRQTDSFLYNLAIYIKVLKHVYRDIDISGDNSSKAMGIMNLLVNNIFQRIVTEAVFLHNPLGQNTLPLLFLIVLAHIFLKNETCAGIN